jgi:hypothetical protein
VFICGALFLVRLKALRKRPRSERYFCQSCSILLAKEDVDEHKDHLVLRKLTKGQLRRPTHMLLALEDNRNNAVVLPYLPCSYSFCYELFCYMLVVYNFYLDKFFLLKASYLCGSSCGISKWDSAV